MRSLLLLCLWAIVGIPAAPAGQQPPAAARSITGAVIAGRVLDITGQPFTRARVTAMVRRAAGEHLEPVAPSVPTNDLGEFRLYGLAAGDYFIQASPNPPAFMPTAVRDSNPPSEAVVATYYAGAIDPALAQAVTIGNQQTLNGIEIGLLQASVYSVSGVVVDRRGRPVANAGIHVRPERNSGGFLTRPPLARSAADGSFKLDGLTTGVYLITPAVPVAGSQAAAIPPEVVARGGVTTSYRYDQSPPVAVVVEGDHVTGVRLTAERPQH